MASAGKGFRMVSRHNLGGWSNLAEDDQWNWMHYVEDVACLLPIRNACRFDTVVLLEYLEFMGDGFHLSGL